MGKEDFTIMSLSYWVYRTIRGSNPILCWRCKNRPGQNECCIQIRVVYATFSYVRQALLRGSVEWGS